MYCSKCGKELPTNSKFCNECGNATTDSMASKTKDEDIRAELKKHGSYTSKHILCLECGYQGIMAITKERIEPKWKSTLAGILTFVGAVLFYLFVWSCGIAVFIIVGAIGGLIQSSLNRTYKMCPACKRKLN